MACSVEASTRPRREKLHCEGGPKEPEDVLGEVQDKKTKGSDMNARQVHFNIGMGVFGYTAIFAIAIETRNPKQIPSCKP